MRKIITFLMLIAVFGVGVTAAFDDFEDGTIDKWEAVRTVGGTMAASTDAEKFGVYGARATTDGENDGEDMQYRNSDIDTDKANLYTWIRVSDTDTGAHYQVGLEPDNAQYSIGIYDGKFYYNGWPTGTEMTEVPSPNTWYRLRIDFDHSEGGNEHADIYLYDADNIELESHLDVSPLAGRTGGAEMVRFRCADYKVGAVTIDWDNACITDTPPPVNAVPDVNIWQITIGDMNYPFDEELPFFSHDGNKTIDFNILDLDNDRLVVDINFNTVAAVGGTSIALDLNLTSAVCSDQDWGDTPSLCGWDWNPTGIADGNYYIIIKITDGEDTNTYYSSKSLGIVNPVFTDFNIFQCGAITATLDLNIASDVNIQFDFNVAIGDFNTASTRVYSHTIHTTDSNCYGWVRDEQKCGWQPTKLAVFSEISSFDGNYNMLSGCVASKVYKHSSFNLEFSTLIATDGTVVLNSVDDWAAVKISHVLTDSNTLYEIHFEADYTGLGSRSLSVYDCNQVMYTSPDNNLNCARFDFTAVTVKHKEEYHIHYTSNDLNQIPTGDGNVLLEADGNHFIYYNCDSCSVAKYWELKTVSESSNDDGVRYWSSSTGFANLAQDNTETPNVHIFWLDLKKTHYFDYIIQVSDNVGNDYNSGMQREEINIVNLPPSVDFVASPEGSVVYNNIIDVNVYVSDALVNPFFDGVVCDINILNASLVPVDTIAFGLAATSSSSGSYHCITTYDTTSIADGDYFIWIRARETTTLELYSADFNTGISFAIDNTDPSIEYIHPPADIDSNTALVTFLVKLDEAGKCYYGIFLNNGLDLNSSADTNADFVCVINYFGFVEWTDTAYLVTNKVEDSIGNSQFDVQRTGTIIYTKPLGVLDPKNIEDLDIYQVGVYIGYRVLAGLAVFIIPFFGLLLLFAFIVLYFKK